MIYLILLIFNFVVFWFSNQNSSSWKQPALTIPAFIYTAALQEKFHKFSFYHVFNISQM